MDEYLVVGSPKEVNISNKLRTNTLSKIKQSSPTDCSEELFSDLRSAVFMEMKVDCFPGFLSSDIFLNHVRQELKKSSGYLDKIGTLKATPSSPFHQEYADYDLTDFSGPQEITDEDFDRIYSRMSLEDNNSTLLFSTPTQSRSISGNSKKTIVRDVMILPFDCHEIFSIVLCSEFGRQLDNKHKIKYEWHRQSNGDKYKSLYMNISTKLGFPLNNRYNPSVASAKKLPNGDIIVISKSVQGDEIPCDRKCVRSLCILAYFFEKIRDNQCKYTFMTIFNLGGFVTPNIIKMLIPYQKKDTLQELITEEGYKRKETGTKGPELDHPINQSLLYNIEKNKVNSLM
ncbi:RGS1 [Acrasis kona]|uniref:RGS1 n=1 Tax=Acrasis kona TaxID=1008807 RepID=A0AAW2YLU5_9EUKA